MAGYQRKALELLTFTLLLIPLVLAAEPSATYTIRISENGDTTAFVVLEGEGTVLLPLPNDVIDPEIRGGIYITSPEGVEVSVGDSGKAIIAYQSSVQTIKEEGVWQFQGQAKEGSQVTVVLPLEVKIVQAEPRAVIKRDDFVKISWDSVPSEGVTVSYIFQGGQSLIDDEASDQRNIVLSTIGIIFAAIVFVGAGLRAYLRRKRRSAQRGLGQKASPGEAEESGRPLDTTADSDKPNITEGQMNIIRAANENEAKVLTLLLKHNGHLKRNVLEKESGISKSSLASALKNLEKKNIVGIDRSFHVHYITLSPWFRKLE